MFSDWMNRYLIHSKPTDHLLLLQSHHFLCEFLKLLYSRSYLEDIVPGNKLEATLNKFNRYVTSFLVDTINLNINRQSYCSPVKSWLLYNCTTWLHIFKISTHKIKLKRALHISGAQRGSCTSSTAAVIIFICYLQIYIEALPHRASHHWHVSL